MSKKYNLNNVHPLLCVNWYYLKRTLGFVKFPCSIIGLKHFQLLDGVTRLVVPAVGVIVAAVVLGCDAGAEVAFSIIVVAA